MLTECEQAQEWMDLLLEDELQQREKEQLDRHLEGCESCRILLAEEQALIQGLRNLQTLPCPDSVVKSVFRMTRPARNPWFKRIPEQIPRLIVRKPAYAFAGILAAAILFWIVPKVAMRNPDDGLAVQKEYSAEEIERSRTQAEWTLLYVSKKLNQAQEKAIKDVVIQDLPKTLQNTIKKTVPFFKGGRI